MAALVSLVGKPRWAIPGILIGLMFATKETFAISLHCLVRRGSLVIAGKPEVAGSRALEAAWRDYRIPVLVSALAAAGTAFGFYTDGFRHPQGAIDAIRTFFVYQTVEGHEKPFGLLCPTARHAAKIRRSLVVRHSTGDSGADCLCLYVPVWPGCAAMPRHHSFPRLCGCRAFPDLQPDPLQDAVARLPAVGACLPASRIRRRRIFRHGRPRRKRRWLF